MQKKRLGLVSVLLLLLVASFLFSCASPPIDEPCRISSVKVNKENEIVIKAELSDGTLEEIGKDGRVYLFGLLPGESVSGIGEMTPIAEKNASRKLTFTLKRDDHVATLIYAKFVLAAVSGGNRTVISPAAYIENPEMLAKASYSGSPASKKGLSGVSASDAEDMFVSQTVIDIDVDKILDCEHSGESCGVGVDTYSVCRETLANIDHLVKTYTDAGVFVYLRFIVKSTSELGNAIPLASVTNFMLERYASSLNSAILAFDLGLPVCDINVTAALVRAFYTAAASANSGAEIYFSVPSVFNTKEGGGAKPLLYELFSTLSYNGELPFGIALDLSVSGALSPEVWSDNIASNVADTEYITVRNLEIFADHLGGEDFLYKGAHRDILVTDFCVSSSLGEDIQAASVAYGYYKALSVPEVKGIIYSALEDNKNTYGLVSESGKKQSYYVFSSLNTDEAEKETAFALRLIGVNRWSALIGSFEMPDAAYTKEYIRLESGKSGAKEKSKVLFDFSGGLAHSFYPSQNALSRECIETGDGFELVFALDPAKNGFGGASAALERGTLKRARYFVCEMSVNSLAVDENVPVNVILSGTKNGKRFVWTASGEVRNGKNVAVCADISEMGALREHIDRVRILTDCKNSEATLTLRSVSMLYKPVSVFVIILIVLGCLAALFALFVGYLYVAVLIREKKRRLSKTHRPCKAVPGKKAPMQNKKK